MTRNVLAWAAVAALLATGGVPGRIAAGFVVIAAEPDEPPPDPPPPDPPPPPDEPPPPPDEPPPPPDEPPTQPPDELNPPTPPEDPPVEPPADPPPADPPPVQPPVQPPPTQPPDTPPPDDPGATPPEDLTPEEKAELQRRRQEADLEARVKAFEEKMRSASSTENDRIKALTDISAFKHPLVAKALIPWIKPKIQGKVRITAIEAAKSQHSVDLGAAASYNLESAGEDLDYARAMIVIMGSSKDPSRIPKLKSIIKNKDSKLELQAAAVSALNEIGHRDSIDDLLALMVEFENPKYPATKAARKNALYPLVKKAVIDFTKQDLPTAKHYAEWWKLNQKTFGLDPEAPK